MHTIRLKFIKVLLFLAGIGFFLHSVSGQSVNTEYFMSSSFTKTSFNPALRPEKGYIGIPGLTNLTLAYKTNTFNLDHFLFPGVGEKGKSGLFLHENVSYDDFMKGISDNNYLDMGVDYTLLGFGFYVKDLFLSFDVSARANTTTSVPKAFFDFVKRGFALEENGTDYDFSNLRVNANAFTQIGIGGSYPVLNHSLVLGAKAKILLGIANASLDIDNMHLILEQDNWRINSEASLRMIYPGMQLTYDQDGKLKELGSGGKSSFINGSGFGFDLGATFKPGNYFDFKDNLAFWDGFTVSAALTDAGFITWNDKTEYLSAHAADQVITGTGTPPIDLNSDDALSDLEDYFKDALSLKKDADTGLKSSSLGAKLNCGIAYTFLKDKLNVGFLTTNHFSPVQTISEFTLAGAYRPFSEVELGLSYSFVHGESKTFGLALHLGHGLYIAGDYLVPRVNSDFIPTSTKALNIQLGFAIPIGAKR
ncbi:MAG: DUF5723 family protein [Dysgonamonadaceae bacterium]|jgi:hypothetical protein|nr:DUF5723 family protein [Dysgonamonadaceae bacterium]